jgi:hypothetical protein
MMIETPYISIVLKLYIRNTILISSIRIGSMYLHNIDHSDIRIQVMLVVNTLATWIQSLVPFN